MDQNTVAKLIHLHHRAISEEGRLRDEFNCKELLRRRLRISQNYYFHHGTSPKYDNFQNDYGYYGP